MSIENELRDARKDLDQIMAWNARLVSDLDRTVKFWQSVSFVLGMVVLAFVLYEIACHWHT